jgi:hypothetical protein
VFSRRQHDPQEDHNKKTDREEDLPMLKYIAIVALLVELSTFTAVSAFMVAGLIGSPSIDFA